MTMGIFCLIDLTRMIILIINQIEHLVNLASAPVNKATYYTQLI
jgi:hypothetical protein